MKKSIITITLMLFFLTGCSNTQLADLPEDNYEIEVTHNQHSGMVAPENPNEKPELDPNFINSVIDEDEKERKEDYVENNMNSVIISSNSSIYHSEQAYHNNYAEYLYVSQNAQADLDYQLAQANQNLLYFLQTQMQQLNQLNQGY